MKAVEAWCVKNTHNNFLLPEYLNVNRKVVVLKYRNDFRDWEKSSHAIVHVEIKEVESHEFT